MVVVSVSTGGTARLSGHAHAVEIGRSDGDHAGEPGVLPEVVELRGFLRPGVKDPVAMEVMRAIKATLDPKGILNPGKVL